MDPNQAKIPTATRIVRRGRWRSAAVRVSARTSACWAPAWRLSAALEAARLGRKVALVDGLPALGGQAVDSIIGTFCGLFANGMQGHQVTHGIADGILHELGSQGALPIAAAGRRTPPS